MIILDLLLTVFVYLAFPTLYVCIKGRVTAKKAAIMASINAIVCAVLFEIVQLTLFANDSTYIPNLGPAFLYFFISKSILTEKNIEKEFEETKEEKISPLCNTCRYNENNFCKTVNNCKDCPNWKQSENNPNEYYCRCDEYEQSEMEDCPYYVAEHESDAIEEESVEDIEVFDKDEDIEDIEYFDDDEDIEDIEYFDDDEDIEDVDNDENDENDEDIEDTLSKYINLLKTFLEETDPNDIFEPKKKDTSSHKVPSLENYVNKEEILNTRCLNSEGLYADFYDALEKIFEDIREDILSQDLLSDNNNYEYTQALYDLLFECLDFFVKVAKEKYDWINDLPLVEMGIKGMFLEMTMGSNLVSDLLFMNISIDDYLKVYYDTMTYVQNYVPLKIEDNGYISPEDGTYESYELYLSLEKFVCEIELNYILRKNANVLVNNVVSTWEDYINTAEEKDISTIKDFIISYPNKDRVKIYDEPSFDYVIIKTTEDMMVNDRGGSLYEATRRYWKISNRITQYKYIISVVDQIVQRVYLAEKWYHYMPGEDGCPTTSDRWGFEGREIHGQEFEKLIGKRIPEKYRGQNPVQYKR